MAKCIAKIKQTKNVSAYNCGNDRCYAEIQNAPVGAYKPTEEEEDECYVYPTSITPNNRQQKFVFLRGNVEVDYIVQILLLSSIVLFCCFMDQYFSL